MAWGQLGQAGRPEGRAQAANKLKHMKPLGSGRRTVYFVKSLFRVEWQSARRAYKRAQACWLVPTQLAGFCVRALGEASGVGALY